MEVRVVIVVTSGALHEWLERVGVSYAVVGNFPLLTFRVTSLVRLCMDPAFELLSCLD